MKSIVTKIVDGDHNPPKGKDEVTLYKMLSSRNINYDGLVDLDMCRFLDKEIFEIENLRTNLQQGDILFTSVGSLGRSCVFDDSGFYCFQRSVSVLTTMIYNYYLKMVLDSPWYQNFIFKNATGTAQKGFYLNQLEKLIVPIPSLAEQNRIYTTFRMLIDII